MSDPRHFLTNSDYPVDKMIWLSEQIISQNLNNPFSLTIPHGLGVVPFVRGVWSADNWNTTYPTAITVLDGQSISKETFIESDENSVYATGRCVGASRMVLRLWGVMNEPSTLGSSVTETATSSTNKLIRSTDFNYPKLFMEGFADATSQTKIVTHGLGFIPQVDIWWRINGRWREYSLDTLGGTGYYLPLINISADTLDFYYADQYANGYFYYRIYADEA